jgi:hypothetical protein
MHAPQIHTPVDGFHCQATFTRTAINGRNTRSGRQRLIRKEPALDLDRGENRLSEKIMLRQNVRAPIDSI